MLYDQNREKYPTTYRFIAWLKTKEPSEKYEWDDASKCVCAQFFGTVDWWAVSGSVYNQEGINFNDLARGSVYNRDQWTWGQLLERAEAALAEKVEA